MKTTTLPERSVSINAIIPASGLISLASLNAAYLSKPSTIAIINALLPNSGFYYVRSDVEDWNPIKGNYSRQINWTIDADPITVTGIPIGINNESPN